MEVVDVPSIPAANGSFGQACLRMKHHAGRIEVLLYAESVAVATGPRGVIEGEQPWLELIDTVSALRTGKTRRKYGVAGVAIHVADRGEPVRQLQRGLKGFRQSQAEVCPDLEAIHHHVNGVLLFLVQLRQVVQVGNPPIDPCAHETGGAQLLENLQVFPFAATHDRRQQHELLPLRHGQHAVDHLAHCLGLQGNVVVGTAGLAYTRIEKSQVIVDLGNRANR